jgi:hypothetical protein
VIPVPTSDAPLLLESLASKIRKSSNFRFEWCWFRYNHGSGVLTEDARHVLSELSSDPACHQFLRDTFDAMYDPSFEIGPIHEHCLVERRDHEFESVLARAAADRLGAYSREFSDVSQGECHNVGEMFRVLGPFAAFELLPGRSSDCQGCSEYNNHLFTNWFFGVAWDWCFVVLWEGSALAWVGLLTDTD